MKNVAKTIVNLSPEEKRVHLEQLLKKKAGGGPKSHTSTPLSFAQARLWVLDQLEPGLSTYNMPAALRITGPLNVAVLERSLNEIIRRHEVLRTTIQAVDGQPIQIVARALTLALPVVDLQEESETEREVELRGRITEQIHQPFDLAQGPLLRSVLFRLGMEDHVFLLVVHHIVSDGWSMGVFERELMALYQAFSSGKPSPLPELPLQYGEFAHWQQQWEKGEAFQQQLSYWREQLSELPVLELPTDHPRPTMQTHAGAKQHLKLSKALSTSLLKLSQRAGVTLFMTLLATFQTLLSRYSGQEDIVVGSVIANRNRAEIEDLIGFFVNTLVLRTDLSGNPTFRQLLHRVRDVTLSAYEHQELPFEKLVEELQPQRDMSRNPLFQVMLTLQNMPEPSFERSGLTLSHLEVFNPMAKFDLTVFIWEGDDGINGTFEYNTDLFDEETIKRMQGHFQTLLEGIVANPDCCLNDLPLLTETERKKLLFQWNETQADYPKTKCLHHLFEEQVAQTPHAVAVVFEDQQLTYRELNIRANQLANYLQRIGVAPGVRVGLYVQRSVEMVVGLLGILKAGGAYVPMDPMYPKERLRFMLDDAQASVLLTQQRLIAELPKSDASLVCLDADWKEISNTPAETPESGVKPKALAYVIYTSGSTGKPKGVAIPHGALVNFLYAMREQPGLEAEDTLLAVTTLSFDIAALELYLPLIVGACVVVVSREVASDGVTLAKQLDLCDATVMQATPATWRLLLESGWDGKANLKILCGGEALPQELAEKLLTKGVALWNLYGPTETTIWSTTYKVEPKTGAMPIGFPIANTQIYLLDSQLNPVPTGIPGELYIGGDGLAEGYLNRPELTAERFVPNPFSAEPGKRLYRTGDLARYLSDGAIDFLGRIDHQIKLRGFRIEIGEIEAVLVQHSGVRQTVVLVREDRPGDTRLVGYIVPNQETLPRISELRRFLQEKLPDYMVPSTFVFLDALPLTPNGKVDRRALPQPDSDRPDLEASFVEPRTPVEEMLADIWAKILKLERIGVHDNFFELGGHSLLATQVISRVRRIFQVDLPLRSLFDGPTVADLSRTLIANGAKAGQIEKIALMMKKINSMSNEEKRKILETKRKGKD
jgi:amino acid adenylation domain-containing protein